MNLLIEKYLKKFSTRGDISPIDFIKDLINRCGVITISREHGSCGGIGESYKILKYLDKYLFEGCIGTIPSA